MYVAHRSAYILAFEKDWSKYSLLDKVLYMFENYVTFLQFVGVMTTEKIYILINWKNQNNLWMYSLSIQLSSHPSPRLMNKITMVLYDTLNHKCISYFHKYAWVYKNFAWSRGRSGREGYQPKWPSPNFLLLVSFTLPVSSFNMTVECYLFRKKWDNPCDRYNTTVSFIIFLLEIWVYFILGTYTMERPHNHHQRRWIMKIKNNKFE